MGLSQSAQDKCMPFICQRTTTMLSLNPDIKLEIRKSQLDTAFMPWKDNGLFTTIDTPKNTVILEFGDPQCLLLNDAMINLKDVMSATTSQKLYDALNKLETQYYDPDRAQQLVNTRMIGNSQGAWYETISDIPANTELLRMYGYTTWTIELLDILTTHNIFGFVKYIHELKDRVPNDPYYNKIQLLDKCFDNYDKTISLENFDLQISTTTPENIGTTIKNQYSMLMMINSLTHL